MGKIVVKNFVVVFSDAKGTSHYFRLRAGWVGGNDWRMGGGGERKIEWFSGDRREDQSAPAQCQRVRL